MDLPLRQSGHPGSLAQNQNRKSDRLLTRGEFTVPRTVRGPFYYLYLAYLVYFLVWSSLRLRAAWRVTKKNRPRASMKFVFLALQLPWVAVVLIAVGADRFIDPAPATSLAVTALFLANELRNGVFDLHLRRWKRLFDCHGEPAFLLDSERDLECANPRAQVLFASLPGGLSVVLEALDRDQRLVHVTVDGRSQWYSVTVTPFDSARFHTNYLLVDATAQQTVTEQIRAVLKEKELVLREVHHRIKNNMSTVIALLTLQAATVSEAEARRSLEDAADRMRGMALLYQKLYQTKDLGAVSTLEYFQPLVREILANFPNRDLIEPSLEIEDFALEERSIQPVGIILNELLTNAMKYAFDGVGHLTVALSRAQGTIRLVVADDGKGLPKGMDLESSGGFGFSLLTTLTRQLSGSVRVEEAPGTRITVEFPE
jgi:two-component sensor histidine kinase